MKQQLQSIRIRKEVLDKVRKRVKQTGQKISGFVEVAVEKELSSKREVPRA